MSAISLTQRQFLLDVARGERVVLGGRIALDQRDAGNVDIVIPRVGAEGVALHVEDDAEEIIAAGPQGLAGNRRQVEYLGKPLPTCRQVNWGPVRGYRCRWRSAATEQ